ncbi:MAG: symmetrical bis(5'-nucleosyl)-tetraphosphatase [Sedimenticola sp.]
MAVYAIGDVQGCYDELQLLLERIRFDETKDKLWFAGDLVNRGPHSLEVLRFVKKLGKRAITVLGNHDLHLLAISEGNLKHNRKDHTLDEILAAPDREELLHWLRHRPLMHHSRKRGLSMIHAGLPPQWDIETALGCARELEATLQGEGFHDYCQQMYGNEPACWTDDPKGMERLRFITNAFTRLRYCDSEGNMALKEKGPPGSQGPALLPWFEMPDRRSRADRILFGHWSTLGYRHQENIWALDTGCLWGGRLTALRLHRKKEYRHHQIDCPGAVKPKQSR